MGGGARRSTGLRRGRNVKQIDKIDRPYPRFTINSVSTTQTIAAKSNDRGKFTELIITNYTISA